MSAQARPPIGRFPAPDPPLADPATRIILRPWRATDAAALVDAWSDPAIAAYCGIPADAGPDRARAWLAGWEDRAARGVALDMVVAEATTDAVLGEVGLMPFLVPPNGAPDPGSLELGWWIGAAFRGAGRATTAVSLMTTWALGTLRVERCVARITRGHEASEYVATSAGLTHRGILDDHHDLWVRSRHPAEARLS